LYVNDEIHESKSSGSGQGQAMMTLARTAEKVIGLTGTLFGGKASDLYDLEFTLNRRVRREYPWGAGGRNRWVKTMGVLERAVEYRPQHDEHGRYTGKRRIERRPEEAPGCSPELVKEIIDHTLFVGLLDSGRPMPPFEEITVPIEMDGDMAGLYDEAKETLGKYLFQCRLEGDASFSGVRRVAA